MHQPDIYIYLQWFYQDYANKCKQCLMLI